MKRVLVMISTYNGEKYIREQLESIYNQEGVDVSVLVRDDGSKDNTIEILEKYRRRMNLMWYTGSNLHATGSFVHLILSANQSYDYYAFCDQDDFWNQDKLRCAISKLKNCNEQLPALYYSGQTLVDEHLNILSHHNISTKRNVQACYIFPQMAGCTAVFNKILLQRIQSYRNLNPLYHDTFVFRLCAAMEGQIVVESKGHIKYRQHENNVVGLDYSLKGKINLLRRHLESNSLYLDSVEIINGYSQYLDRYWIELLNNIIDSKKSVFVRYRLIFSRGYYFGDIKLRIIFVIKILFGML